MKNEYGQSKMHGLENDDRNDKIKITKKDKRATSANVLLSTTDSATGRGVEDRVQRSEVDYHIDDLNDCRGTDVHQCSIGTTLNNYIPNLAINQSTLHCFGVQRQVGYLPGLENNVYIKDGMCCELTKNYTERDEPKTYNLVHDSSFSIPLSILHSSNCLSSFSSTLEATIADERCCSGEEGVHVSSFTSCVSYLLADSSILSDSISYCNTFQNKPSNSSTFHSFNNCHSNEIGYYDMNNSNTVSYSKNCNNTSKSCGNNCNNDISNNGKQLNIDMKKLSIKSIPKRYIMACCGNIEEANRRWNETIKWRKINNICNIIFEKQTYFFIIKKFYSHFFHKKSKNGHVVYYERPGNANFSLLRNSGVTRSILVRHYIFLMELLWGKIDKREEGQLVYIFDCKNFNILLKQDEIELLLECLSILQNYYPERTYKIFIINSTCIFRIAWNSLYLFLNKRTVKKINVLGQNFMDELLVEIAEENIPAEYGGKDNTKCGEDSIEQFVIQHVLAVNKLKAG